MPFQIETFKLLSVVRAMRMIANTQQQTPRTKEHVDNASRVLFLCFEECNSSWKFFVYQRQSCKTLRSGLTTL